MYNSSYMFRHYMANIRERSSGLRREAQVRNSRSNIGEGRVVSRDVVRPHHVTRHNIFIFLLGILIFKGLTARRLYKSFHVKGLSTKPRQLETL
jgi:hypothetical protein